MFLSKKSSVKSSGLNGFLFFQDFRKVYPQQGLPYQKVFVVPSKSFYLSYLVHLGFILSSVGVTPLFRDYGVDLIVPSSSLQFIFATLFLLILPTEFQLFKDISSAVPCFFSASSSKSCIITFHPQSVLSPFSFRTLLHIKIIQTCIGT